jgi:hypothetical protein
LSRTSEHQLSNVGVGLLILRTNSGWSGEQNNLVRQENLRRLLNVIECGTP